MKNNFNVKALTFDTGGTILDWHSGFKAGFEKIKTKYKLSYLSSELANIMRKKSLNKVTSQNNSNLINFDLAHKFSVEEILSEKNIDITEEDKIFLYHTSPAKLKTWPDFLEPFNLLKKKYYCVSFTLLSNRLVYINSKANNIFWDLVLSCETLEVYKPDILAYKKTADLLQFSPEECLMVACHSFDLNAAQNAGFRTAFIKRDKEWGVDTKIEINGNYDFVCDNFQELYKILNK